MFSKLPSLLLDLLTIGTPAIGYLLAVLCPPCISVPLFVLSAVEFSGLTVWVAHFAIARVLVAYGEEKVNAALSRLAARCGVRPVNILIASMEASFGLAGAAAKSASPFPIYQGTFFIVHVAAGIVSRFVAKFRGTVAK